MQTSETETAPGISEFGILSSLRNFVNAKSTHGVYSVSLADDDKLSGISVVGSTGVARLIYFIESEFGVYVSMHEITEENFGTLRAVARFVANKQPFAVG